MSTFNIERLRKAVEWAEYEAAKGGGQWDQSNWGKGQVGRVRKPALVDGAPLEEQLEPGETLVEVKCKTAYCIAGWACHEEKDAFVSFNYNAEGSTLLADYVIPKGSNEAVYIEARARELFGITEDEADKLFMGNNRIEDIRRIAQQIAKKYGETL